MINIQGQGTGLMSRMKAGDLVVGEGETLQAGERTQHTAVRKGFDSEAECEIWKVLVMGSMGVGNSPDTAPNPCPGHGPGSSHLSQGCNMIYFLCNMLGIDTRQQSGGSVCHVSV